MALLAGSPVIRRAGTSSGATLPVDSAGYKVAAHTAGRSGCGVGGDLSSWPRSDAGPYTFQRAGETLLLLWLLSDRGRCPGRNGLQKSRLAHPRRGCGRFQTRCLPHAGACCSGYFILRHFPLCHSLPLLQASGRALDGFA